MSFMRSVFSVGFLTICCRITGYLRDLLVAQFIGANAVSDAIALALRIPSFFRRVFAEGAFHVSFLPIFSQLVKEDNPNHSHEKGQGKDPKDLFPKAFHFASSLLTLLTLSLWACVVVGEWFFPQVSLVLFSGLKGDPQRFDFVVKLSQIMLPFVFFISLTSFFGSILNGFGHFNALSISQGLGNVAIIVFFYLGTGYTKEYGLLFAFAVLFSGVVQLGGILVTCVRKKLWVGFQWPQWTPSVKRFFKKFGPGLLGVSAVQLNILVGLYFAAQLKLKGVSYLGYADRLNQLPLSVIGVSLSTVLLPTFAKQLSGGLSSLANKALNNSLRFAFILTGLVTVVVMGFSPLLTSLLFGQSKLSVLDLQEIAIVTAIYGVCVVPNVLIKIFSTWFFALGQPKVPLYGSVVGLVVDVFLCWIWVSFWQHKGIAMAIGLSSWSQGLFLGGMAYVQGWKPSVLAHKTFKKVFLLCLVGLLGVYGIFSLLPSPYLLSFPQKLGLFVLLISGLVFAFLRAGMAIKLFSKKQWYFMQKSFLKRKAPA